MPGDARIDGEETAVAPVTLSGRRPLMFKHGVFAMACALVLTACSDNNEICGDGEDNDSNGQVDCADSACGVGTVCGPNGLACAGDQTCTSCSG